MHEWLDEAGRRIKYVLWGPGGVGKSTLAACLRGQVDAWLPASTMEQDYTGLLDAMLGKSAGRAPSYEELRGRVQELLQSSAWSRAWLAVLTTCPR